MSPEDPWYWKYDKPSLLIALATLFILGGVVCFISGIAHTMSITYLLLTGGFNETKA